MATSAEYWFNLPLEDRLKYEKAVHYIVYSLFRGDYQAVINLIYTAYEKKFSHNPTVGAILWRMSEEIGLNDD